MAYLRGDGKMREVTRKLLKEAVFLLLAASLLASADALIFRPHFFLTEEITLEQARSLWEEGKALFIDPRPLFSYAEGHIPGAFQCSPGEIEWRMEEIRREVEGKEVVICCEDAICSQGKEIVEFLKKEGIKGVRLFKGGFEEWREAGYPEERGW